MDLDREPKFGEGRSRPEVSMKQASAAAQGLIEEASRERAMAEIQGKNALVAHKHRLLANAYLSAAERIEQALNDLSLEVGNIINSHLDPRDLS